MPPHPGFHRQPKESAMYVCNTCSALVVDQARHRRWHAELDRRINAAAQVGAHADMVTRLLGSSQRGTTD